ncbi:MAG: hypothetical protein LBG05_02060, partial [Treponema sp.]|nr:hypothetical protein [Treponema sp.]
KDEAVEIPVHQAEVDFEEKTGAIEAVNVGKRRRGRPAKVDPELITAVAETIKKREINVAEPVKDEAVEIPVQIKKKRGRPAKNK